MSRFIFLVLLLLVGSSTLRAQTAPAVQWQRRVGIRGANGTRENAWSVYHTRRNRVVALGYSQTGNNSLSALWTLNNRGDSLRSVIYPNSSFANGYDNVAEANNGDLWFSGMASVPATPGQPFQYSLRVARTDSLGTLRWARVLPISVANTYAIQPVPDGGALLVVSGQHPLGTPNFPVSVPTVVRVDSLGSVVWTRTYGDPYWSIRAITPLADGSYGIAGEYYSGPPQWTGGTRVLRITIGGDTIRTRKLAPNGGLDAIAATPNGGLLLGGGYYNAVGAAVGLLMQTDSLDHLLWQRDIAPLVPAPTGSNTAYISYVRALAQAGHVLAGGFRNNVRPPYPAIGSYGYLAEFAPAGPGTAAPVWEQQYQAIFDPKKVAEGPGPVLTVVGNYVDPVTRDQDLLFTRIGPLPAFYQVPYCQRPPAAYFAAAATGPAGVQVLDASTAGPRYAQLVAYRWAWGDGTASSGPAPGPHAYARPPGPGTALTLTVTNNLGCTSTHTAYPFGPLAAAQAGRALQAGLTLHPNPSTGRVAVALAGLAPQGPAALALLDGLGRTVLAATAPVSGGALATTLDLGPLPPGLYLLRVSTREGTATRRVVRE